MLARRGIPIVVITGYDDARLPDVLKGFPRVQKPADLREVVRALANHTAAVRLH